MAAGRRDGPAGHGKHGHNMGSDRERRSIIARMMTHDGKTYVGALHFIYCANGDGAMAWGTDR